MAGASMFSNIEIKAKLLDKQQAINTAKQLSQSEGATVKQEDTFYNVHNGRLKLRVIDGVAAAQLISYSRQDQAGPKKSDFSIATTETPADLNRVLTESLGVLGCVKKTRLLFLVGQTRIHIDSVCDLGDFIELEVVLKEGQDPSEGAEIAQGLMEELNIESDQLITCAYMDLILRQSR